MASELPPDLFTPIDPTRAATPRITARSQHDQAIVRKVAKSNPHAGYRKLQSSLRSSGHGVLSAQDCKYQASVIASLAFEEIRAATTRSMDRKHLATMWGIAQDKLQLLSGRPTVIVGTEDDSARAQRAALAKTLLGLTAGGQDRKPLDGAESAG